MILSAIYLLLQVAVAYCGDSLDDWAGAVATLYQGFSQQKLGEIMLVKTGKDQWC